MLVLTLNSAVTNNVNGRATIIKQELYQNRMQTAKLVSSAARRTIRTDVLATIEKVIADTVKEPLAEVTLIKQLFKKQTVLQKLLKEDRQHLKAHGDESDA